MAGSWQFCLEYYVFTLKLAWHHRYIDFSYFVNDLEHLLPVSLLLQADHMLAFLIPDMDRLEKIRNRCHVQSSPDSMSQRRCLFFVEHAVENTVVFRTLDLSLLVLALRLAGWLSVFVAHVTYRQLSSKILIEFMGGRRKGNQARGITVKRDWEETERWKQEHRETKIIHLVHQVPIVDQ